MGSVALQLLTDVLPRRKRFFLLNLKSFWGPRSAGNMFLVGASPENKQLRVAELGGP